jgi:hypothetical protein
LSATRAACESRAIGFPLNLPVRIVAAEYNVVRCEPRINSTKGTPPDS